MRPSVNAAAAAVALLTFTGRASAQVEEVTIQSTRREIGQTKLPAADVREMPGAFGDAFRAVDAMPGVVPITSGVPYSYIRGAPPNDNAYSVDGVRVPLLFHVGLGPSVIHPLLLDHVDFYPGAAPASFGRFAGATIAGQTRAPERELHGGANLRLVDAGALVEAPIGGGSDRESSLTALAAARYGYPGLVVSALSDVTLSYWDYQSRVAWRVGDKDTLSVFAFGSHDRLAHVASAAGGVPNGGEREDFVSDFHRIDLRYDHALEDGRLRVAGTFGWDSQGASPTYLDDTSGAVRIELEKKIAPGLRWRSGVDARLDDYAFHQVNLDDMRIRRPPSTANPPPTNVTWGASADVVWQVTPRFEVVPGARFDVFESHREGGASRAPAIDPRLATRLRITPRVAWLSAFGLAHQYPTLRVGDLPAAVVAGSGFPVGGGSLQEVAQASQGIEVSLPADVLVTTTAFLSSWTSLTDLTSQCYQLEPAVIPAIPPDTRLGMREETWPWACPNNAPVHGRAYGVEFLARRQLSKRFGAWLSYTLSRSTREAQFPTETGGTNLATVPSEYDRTHVLQAIGTLDLGRRWRVGSRFVMYSGAPYSNLSGNFPVPPYNALRDPFFFRLDVRVEKRWPLGAHGTIAFVFEGQNVTLSTERSPLALDCVDNGGPGGGTNTCKRATIGPIAIPSIGVEAFY